MQSTLKNMILSLLGITFVASAAVAIVSSVTAEPIRVAQQAAVDRSLEEVLPPFESNFMESVVVDGLAIDIYTALDGNSNVVGFAVKSQTKKGYSGNITLMVGLTPTFEVIGVSVLSHAETPGLGSKMVDEGNPLITSIERQSLESFDLRVKKDGGEVDALSGATVTSRAYCDAIGRGYGALVAQLKEMMEGGNDE